MKTLTNDDIQRLTSKIKDLSHRGGISITQLIYDNFLDARWLAFNMIFNRGGVPLAESILKGDIENSAPKQPDWCTCKHCIPMNTELENVCCEKQECITEDRHFPGICLDYYVLVAAITLSRERKKIQELKKDKDYNKIYRWAAYGQYTLWIHGHLGRGNRVPCPSCVVTTIRLWYPAANGQPYEGFKLR